MLSLSLLLLLAPAHAGQRVAYTFDANGPIDVAGGQHVAQDPLGRLWFGTYAGLLRYDGRRWERVAPEGVDDEVFALDIASDGTVWASDLGQPVAVRGGVAERLPRPDGEAVHDLCVDGADRVWAAAGGKLWRWDAAWAPFELPERVGYVRCFDRPWALTSGGAWEILPSGPVRRLTRSRLVDVAPFPDGTVWSMSFVGPLLRHDGEGEVIEEIASTGQRGVDLVRRAGTLWASFDRSMAARHPDGRVEWLEVPYGGRMHVDREGSLWSISPRTIAQYPEPDTVGWGQEDGLPSPHTRFLASTAEALWVGTWQGLGRIERAGRTASTWSVLVERDRVCADAAGRVWAVGPTPGSDERDVRYAVANDPTVPARAWPGQSARDCATDADGRVWVTDAAGVWVIEEMEARAVPPPPDQAATGTATIDQKGRLWVGRGEEACHADTSALASGTSAWTCEDLGAIHELYDLSADEEDRIWAATRRRGVMVREDGAWRELGAPPGFASPRVRAVIPSPRGGMWTLGMSAIARVALADGALTVLERLDGWHGLPSHTATDLVEDPDGTLWLATGAGVIELPPRAREAEVPVPSVALVRMAVDGEPLPLDAPGVLPWRRNRLELAFAAPSYRNPKRLRYRIRLGDRVEETSEPSIRYVDLPAGEWAAEVQASLDGRRWSEPAVARVVVRAPLWARWWALVGYGALLGLTGLGAHRIRLARRLAVEQERVRISMDLHDELGAGLGGIGLRTGLLARDDLDASKRREIARAVAAHAQELSGALTDIVWSLRSSSARPQVLLDHLADRAQALFEGSGTRLRIEAPPSWPGTPLSLPVRRALQLIALEALHNAARHAGATTVTLRLAPGRPMWTLEVEDDGRGLSASPDPRPGGGTGLEGMERRASRIGATLIVGSAGDRGTRVTVSFRPDARESARQREP